MTLKKNFMTKEYYNDGVAALGNLKQFCAAMAAMLKQQRAYLQDAKIVGEGSSTDNKLAEAAKCASACSSAVNAALKSFRDTGV